MSLFSCIAKVRDHSVEDHIANDETESKSRPKFLAKSLLDLSTELLVKILCYLSTRDRITMRYVSRRFQDVTKIPSTWKEFVWPEYEPRHVCSVNTVIKAHGEHVRRISFPGHLTPAMILEMMHCCKNVTHLNLPRNTQLSLNDLEKIVCTITRLEQLDISTAGDFIESQQESRTHPGYFILQLLKVVAASSVSELSLRIDQMDCSVLVAQSIEVWANQGKRLPSTINIFAENDEAMTSQLFTFWSTKSAKLPSFEVCLYDIKRVPMKLYPVIPLRKFQFGPAATAPLIQLSHHGIVGLEYDEFYFTEYNHYGTLRHTVTPSCSSESLITEKHLNPISHLNSVSYLDIHYANVFPNHLEQLAVMCPNLQRLNLRKNDNCLKDLRGLHAIVHTCQNLEGFNLAGISMSSVESKLCFWELLSGLKKLTDLSIDLCAVNQCDLEDGDNQKLVETFKSFVSLKALEIRSSLSCVKCRSKTELLFSHFPSLTHCRMHHFPYSGLAYALTNCHQLKYLYEINGQREKVFPLLSNCHLQQLYINSPFFVLTDKSVKALSTHGELECVCLYIHPSSKVNSITIDHITTLINNSPNLILLHILCEEPSCEGRTERDQVFLEFEQKLKKKFSSRKLVTTGSFKVRVVDEYPLSSKNIELFDTDLKSLWPSVNNFNDVYGIDT